MNKNRLPPAQQDSSEQKKILELQNHIKNLENEIRDINYLYQIMVEKDKRYNKLILPKLLKPLFQLETAMSSLNRYRKGLQILVREKGDVGLAYQTLKNEYQKNGFKATKKLLKTRAQSKGFYLPQAGASAAVSPDYQPKISVIVPNYNHAQYIVERLDSIIHQTYQNIELIILDDHSSDNSVEVIQQYFQNKSISYQLIVNEHNSGNVFKQWQKGIQAATGEWIWICESDDVADVHFLNNLLPVLSQSSVNIAFGRIQFMNNEGRVYDGLDDYRNVLNTFDGQKLSIFPAFYWFNGVFGVRNVYANVGGGVFRRQLLSDAVWQRAAEFKICGDWYLYLQLAGAGQIAYVPDAVAYFRQHERNTSASNFNKPYYYQERLNILYEIKKKWRISPSVQQKFLDLLRQEYEKNNMQQFTPFESLLNKELLDRQLSESLHIQLYFLGFHAGGGELFPIVLANELHDLGHTVSMVALDLQQINPNMKCKLNSQIVVYHISEVLSQPEFLHHAGVDVIHSHIVNADRVIVQYLKEHKINIPYLVTMHGSHNPNNEDHVEESQSLADYVSKWVYIADKNLDYFRNMPLPNTVKFPNAMPIDHRLPESSRQTLGIGDDDVVFAFAARGIAEKGWLVLVQAFLALQQMLPENQTVHLVLMGEGDAQSQAKQYANQNAFIHFLGYELAVNGVLRYADCLVLPTRFEGESYPLCLIQAIQEGLPCIATNTGEIANMIRDDDGQLAGILLQNTPNDELFRADLTAAMWKMCDTETRLAYQQIAKNLVSRYDMTALAEKYVAEYWNILER